MEIVEVGICQRAGVFGVVGRCFREAHGVWQELDAIMPTGQLNSDLERGWLPARWSGNRSPIQRSLWWRACGAGTATIRKRHHADHVALVEAMVATDSDIVLNIVQQV